MAATNKANAHQTAVQRQQRMIWRLPTVKFATGLGRSKIYNLMKEGRFPKARRIAGAHVVGWDSLEVEAWISEQLECQ
ncbi:helix-turn-helix transcriptional regulator [Pseudomonas sp. NPDC087690]|jgi:prophage regulatory protein|uniref:helix-turn-helix transcriptional regulator n=1 Tax=Pseudomonas sp. NPDC087690 TaxID=3364446 RepID=UPI0038260997